MSLLPEITDFSGKSNSSNILCILSEGFEQRSLAFVRAEKEMSVKKVIVCQYEPVRNLSKYNELIEILAKQYRSNVEIKTLVFDRHKPVLFEEEIQKEFINCNDYDEIIIDISVMSKYMIMQLFCSLSNYSKEIKIIYTEPESYAPNQEEYNRNKIKTTMLPSYGVHDVIRTPLLTSIIMQKSPALLVSFLSFNEQLIRALLSEIEPSHLFLVNGVPPVLSWREKAMIDIHKNIIDAYPMDNEINDVGLLTRKASTLYYQETVKLLADIYRDKCIDTRIIVAPTGSKMQALGCSIIKLCCPDIHIEYPTPESYYVDGYSSSEIRQIHQVVFNNLPCLIKEISSQYQLNG